MYKIVELTVLSRFSPKEENIQKRQKLQNKLFMNTIKIWGMAFKGQQWGDHRLTIGLCRR